ncbi:hypothetical protein Stok01_02400 [Sulfurisphaera tokodaii]
MLRLYNHYQYLNRRRYKLFDDMNHNIFDVLRELDSIVDFGRAKIQWDILLYIASKGPSSVSEIAEATNNSRKAVLDAIRKLTDKELVVKIKYDIYDLSEKGKEILNKLNDLTHYTTLPKIEDEIPLNNSIQYFYLIEMLKASLINSDVLPVEKVSRELGISTQTLKYYIDLFAEKGIFKKINKKTLFGHAKQCYIITSEGKKLAYRIPSLIKMKNNIFLRFLLKVTFSLRYDTALIKIMIFLALTSPIIIYYLNVPFMRYIGIVWLYVLIFFTLLSVYAYITAK